MSANNLWRVTYHFETSGKKVSDVFQDNVIAASSDYNTIAAVLSGNSRTNNGRGTLVIVSVQHLAGASNVLS